MLISVGRLMSRSSGVSAAAISAAATALADETDGLALNFDDAAFLSSTSFYGSARVKHVATPANNYDSIPRNLLTYTGPVAAGKVTRQPDGRMLHSPHNLFLNSAAPANQSVTVISGASYDITITGATTTTLSGAATGTITAGTTTVTATTGTLTFGSTSGAGTLHLRRSGSVSTYVATAGSAVFGLPFEWGSNLFASPTAPATQGVTVVSGERYTITVEGSGSITLSGAATGTVTSAAPLTVKATTTTLTCTVAGSPTQVHVREALGIRVVEEARTNSLLHAIHLNSVWTKVQTAVTENAAVSPSGLTNASLFYCVATNTSARSQFQVSKPTTPGAPYTAYVDFKYRDIQYGILTYYDSVDLDKPVWFDLINGTIGTVTAGVTATMEPLDNGWYRCTVTYTATGTTGGVAMGFSPTNGVSSFAGTAGTGIYAYGAQFEAGSNASSFIPTFGSTVTRAADSATLATSLFPWNVAGATIYVKYRPVGVSTDRRALVLDDGTANEVITLGNTAGAAGYIQITDGGATQTAPLTAGTVSASAFERLAASIAANDVALVSDGGSEVTDTSVTLPTVTTLRIGAGLSAAGAIDGHIKEVIILPRTSTEAQLQALGVAA